MIYEIIQQMVTQYTNTLSIQNARTVMVYLGMETIGTILYLPRPVY